MPRYDAVGVRRLGLAVLNCAFYDAAGLAAPVHRGLVRGGGDSVDEVAREAYAWLTTPSERLDFWSECAGLDMRTVIDGADAGVAFAKRTPKDQSLLSGSRRRKR